MSYRKDPYRFAEEVAKAGYATDPNYANKVKRIMKEIEQIIVAKELYKKQTNFLIPMSMIGVSILIIVVAVFKNKQK